MKFSFTQMRIAQCRLDALMPHKRLNGPQWDTRHHQSTCERVPQIVPAKIGKLYPLDYILKLVPPIPFTWSVEWSSLSFLDLCIALRSERRSALKKHLTEPTLLEISGNPTHQALDRPPRARRL